jgi:hypothetical protein
MINNLYNSNFELTGINTKTSNNTTLFDYSYSFNHNTGNLTSRTDNMQSMTENFFYDNMNRLDTIKRDVGLTNVTNYHDNGNIDYKYKAGTYSYLPNKPHAVTEITSINTNINLQTQQITYKGLIKTDPNKSNGARVWEFVSRHTWQAPQTITGHLFFTCANTAYQVNNVSHGYGVTAVDIGSKGAVTIGNYSGGPEGYRADWKDHLFVHEYGHYVQSQQHGPAYLLTVGLPSLQSAISDNIYDTDRHDTRWFEADASYKGAKYFDKHYGSGKDGYVAGSADYFDRESFINGRGSPYTNPRNGGNNRFENPTGGQWHWTDLTLYIPIFGSFPYAFLSLSEFYKNP